MTTFKPNQHRTNFIGQIAREWTAKYTENDGILDPVLYISDSYQILFLNYFAADYAIRLFDDLQEAPAIFRHRNKQAIKNGAQFVESIIHEIVHNFRDHKKAFLNMNDNLYLAFKEDTAKLEETMHVALAETIHNCKLPEDFIVRINLAYMFAMFANNNLDGVVAQTRFINPEIEKVYWTRLTTLLRSLDLLFQYNSIPQLQKDIRFYGKWTRIMKRWYDTDWLSDHLGVEDTESELIENFNLTPTDYAKAQ